MMVKTARLGIIAASTAALWVFPSFGTQGMGTLRQAYGHTDRQLFTAPISARLTESLLRNVDRRVDAAVVAPDG